MIVSLVSRSARGAAFLLLALAVVGTQVVLTRPAHAQQPQMERFVRAGDIPSPEDFDIREAHAKLESQFQLFGLADLAVVGMRGRGSMTHKLTNTGPIDYYFKLGYAPVYQSGTPTGTQQMFFEGPLWAGTPAGEWQKHRQVVASLNNVLGGGYNSATNVVLLTGATSWRAADGQLGLVTSGTSATEDGACTDFTSDRVTGGAPLGAASDCPVTWGSDQFEGASRRIEFLSWVDYFDDVTLGGTVPQNFSWDWWKVPEEYVSDKLVGDYQTYHTVVDWASDKLVQYGDVVPGGVGDPQLQGYPMGLSFVVDAFSFENPRVTNVTYWRAMLINESEKVYGVGLDYDSLYIGELPEPLSGTQADAFYYRPEIGALLIVDNGVNPNCNGALTPSGVYACYYPLGFDTGASAIIVLNSPIGDLRNKAFSDPLSPFYAPDHPNAGDTITFNHGHLCGYGGCFAGTINRSARAGFGMVSSRPADVLDGRTVNDFSDRDYFRIFRNYDFPTRTGQFNRYITPEGWRYTNRPPGTGAGPDTLYFDTCISSEFNTLGLDGCSDAWSDTLPGGINNAYCNLSAGIGIGPFPLAAGDTAKFTLAIVTGEGRSEIEANVREATGFYRSSYLGPKAPTPTAVVSISASPGDRAREGGAEVRLFLDDGSEEWVDTYLALKASDFEAGQFAIDNPWVADSLRSLSSNNVRALHVFKSCDGGDSFTNDADCEGDPARDETGAPVKTGWQPYETFEVDEEGRFPNQFVDGSVTPGKTYLYIVVAETYGAEFSVVERDGADNPVATILDVAPSLMNPLSRSVTDPNVVKVYVPASRQAGGQAAEVQFTEDDPIVTVEYHPLDVVLTADISEAASYRLVFGDSVVVTRVTGADAVSNTVELFRTVPALVGGSVERVAYDSATYTRTDPFNGVDVAGGVTTSVGGTTVTVYADELTLLALDGSTPLFTSSVLDGENTTPGALLGRPDFAYWLVNVDNSRAGSYLSQRYFEGDDSVRSAGAPYLEWRDGEAVPNVASRAYTGEYEFSFSGPMYGPAHLFTVNVVDPGETQEAFTSSLNQRVNAASTTSVDPAIAAVIGVAPDELIEVELPFTVHHATTGRDVTVAMLASSKLDSIPLGRGLDLITVAVPADQWVPGEPLIFVETVTTFLRDTAGAPGQEEYVILDGSGQPVTGDTTLVTWSEIVLGCEERMTCNPVVRGSPGASDFPYAPVKAGYTLRVRYLSPMSPETGYAFEIQPTITGEQVTELSPEDYENIKVVPNPYIVYSRYEHDIASPATTRRLMFAGLPPEGTIEIYTVAGRFVQRITYTASDLVGNGDLFWDMRTREGNEIASGLYLFVLEGRLPASDRSVRKIGKFVVIR
jgi:hypothetical protein